jgi:hypothetical protein
MLGILDRIPVPEFFPASSRLWRRADGCGGEQTAVAASRRLWRRADGCGGEQTDVAA